MKLPLLYSAAILAAPLFAVSAIASQPDPEPKADKAETKQTAVEAKEESDSPTIVIPEVKEEKRICRRISTDMSSRRKERVCLTQDGWREFNQRR